jgi:hypothetical protein
MLSHFIYYYAECRYAECHYAECRYAECHYAECRNAEWAAIRYFTQVDSFFAFKY